MPTSDEGRQKRKSRVVIDGEEFVIRGSAAPEYVQELAKLVDQKIMEVRRTQPNLPRHRSAILAALHLADELYKVSKERAELMEVLEEAR